MSEECYPINIWINEERFAKLQQAGIADMAEDVLAGLKVIKVPTTAAQRDVIVAAFPMAKCDTATTKTIELLPREIKDKVFDLVVQQGSVDVIERFLRTLP